jgi:hypothetical protein
MRRAFTCPLIFSIVNISLQNYFDFLEYQHLTMSASQDQSSLNSSSAAGAHFDSSSNSSAEGTPFQSAASATAAGHGDHPQDNADESNVIMPGSKVGPQQENLEGEQMRMAGEGQVMDAQFNKRNVG